MKPFTRNMPDWVRVRVNRRRGKIVLRGTGNWQGRPVVGRPRINLRDDITKLNVNRMMQASYRVSGTTGRDNVVFGNQAGAITKRTRSIINFKDDNARDRFVFTNNVPGKPFNHMQRFVIKNFGREDVIVLRNIGRKFRWDDLVTAGDGRYVLPGVPPTSLTVFSQA